MSLCVYCEVEEGCESTVITMEPGMGTELSVKIVKGWGIKMVGGSVSRGLPFSGTSFP